MYKTLVVLLCSSIILASAMSPRPELPTSDLCRKYKEKCELRAKNIFCKQRTEECLLYSNKGLDIAWSFCMFSNSDDLAICNERILIDYEIISNAVKDDSFKYDFAF